MKNTSIRNAVCSLRFILFPLAVLASLSACNEKKGENTVIQEDEKAKQMLQGIWINENDESPVFRFQGDSIYYPDKQSEPVRYSVYNDSIHLFMSTPVNYSIKVLTKTTLRLIDDDGDEIELISSNDKAVLARFTNSQHKEGEINQNELIKRDSVLTHGDKRLHAYVQINPTRFKVLHQSVTTEGLNVEKAYYDNIIHVSIYDGAQKIFGRDFKKTDFSQFVPQNYLSTSILSDIVIKTTTDEGTIFEAIITEPESYTSYHVTIIINNEGKLSMRV